LGGIESIRSCSDVFAEFCIDRLNTFNTSIGDGGQGQIQTGYTLL